MRRWYVLASAALLGSACGRELGFGEAPVVVDAGASPPDGDVVDAGPPIVLCDSYAVFGTPALIGPDTISSAEEETSVTLTADERTMVFGRYHPTTGGYDVMVASRSDVSAAFGAPTLLFDVGARDTHPWISPDGLTILFASPRLAGNWDLFEGVRTRRAEGFGVIRPIRSSPSHEVFPFASADGAELYFTEVSADQSVRIRRAARAPDGTLAEAVPFDLGDFHSEAPVVSTDGLALYFASSRFRDAGGADILVVRRPTRDVRFDSPQPVAELNLGEAQRPGWLSPDGCRLYFTSKRGTSLDIYVAARSLRSGI